MHDYWIGDKVWIVSLNRTGIFEGDAPEGKAKVKIDGQHYFHAFDDLKLFEGEENEPKIENAELKSEPQYTPFLTTSFESAIDLHIEKLSPVHRHASTQQILLLQKQECRRFVKNAFDAGRREVLIIHGKGTGVLKEEVRNITLSIDPGAHLEEINEDGATRVYFS